MNLPIENLLRDELALQQTRRSFLAQGALGIGGIALNSLLLGEEDPSQEGHGEAREVLAHLRALRGFQRRQAPFDRAAK